MRLFFSQVVVICFLVAVITTGITALAQVSTSTNYQIHSDSLNIGGGISSSSNYIQESTVGEIATGVGTSSNYELRAGNQQMQEVFISMTAAADVVMSPDLPGLTGGVSNCTTSVVVTTDSAAGYSLSIESEGTPAMQNGISSIADYPASSTPDYDFTVGSGQAYFGYSVTSADAVQMFKDNGVDSCAVGLLNSSGKCWRGLATNDVVISQSSGSNQPLAALQPYSSESVSVVMRLYPPACTQPPQP